MKVLIGLLLLVSGHGVSSVIHSLKYFYTGSSGLSTFPEFVAVGMVDEVQLGYYDSNIQRIVLKQTWMDQATRDDPDYLERETGIARGAQQTFKSSIETLKKRFNQTGGAQIVQWMYGCEWDEEDGTTDGYNQQGYDGEDFISFDLKTMTWIAPVHQAFPTKQRWNQDRAQNQYLKNYLTKECVDWLKKYLAYGKSTLQRTEVPRVSLLQRGPSSPVVCHATGFYPDRVVVFWRRDGQELHEHVDHGEVLPNHDGTFQVSVDLDLASVPQEDWGRYECVFKLKGIEDILTPLDPALIRTNWGKTGLGGDGVIHSLKYFYTASSGVSTFPEFVIVGMVDEVQAGYYDSNIQRIVIKQTWMDQFARDHPDELEWNTGRALDAQQEYKVMLETLKKRFNQTGGAHIVQKMYGCEWDDEDDTTDGYEQFGYDGEDFISWDVERVTWFAPVPQALSTKHRWDEDEAQNERWKNYYTKECVDWLKKYLDYGKSTLQRTEVPRVSLLQRGPSSPVVCHATGFYPDRVVVFWRRDGQELHEHVDQGEVLPNHDGTFQVSVDLDLASVPQEDWGRYECVVKLKGIEDILIPLDPALIRTNWGKTGLGGDGGDKSDITTPIIIGSVVLLLTAAAVVGVFLYKKRNVIHSLKYFYTGSSGVSNFPEFVAVGMVDEVQFDHYDSNIQRVVIKQAWMDQVTRDDPDYLERNTGIRKGHQQAFKANIEIAKKRFNQTGGAHIVQFMYGCEWDDEDDTTDGYRQYGYDGEDFISFDLEHMTWIAPVPQAVTTKLKWDQDKAELEHWKNYQTKECVDWLKKLLTYGKSTLQRTEVPQVSLLQRGPSSPVVCHATGFYPDRVVVFWRRDGQELQDHVDHGEVLPNHDGTFQVSVDLDLASVPQEDWGRYECVVQLKGIEGISTKLDPALIRTNWSDITTPIIIGFVVLLLAAAAVVGVFLYKKRNGDRPQTCKPTDKVAMKLNKKG
ncbi:unnamed protein product [Lota lota]